MEKARCNTELYSNLREPLNNVKPSNFWGSHHSGGSFILYTPFTFLHIFINEWVVSILFLSLRDV